MLDKRLMAAASLVRKDSLVCDVGTDHGYLPIYLIKNNIAKECIASDVNIMPLNSAKQAILNAGYKDKIKTVLSDGLKDINSCEVDDIIICGMGGELIMKIINECEFSNDENKHFILQPMTNKEYLRKALYENGFKINREIPVIDKRHVYTIISACYCGEKKIVDDVFSYVGKIPNEKTNDALLYIEHLKFKLKKVITGLEKSIKQGDDLVNNDKLSFYQNLLKNINEINIK